MSVPSLSYLLLSSAAVLLVTAAEASAQTCTKAPSCAELGYTKSVSDCIGKNVLYCPFDSTAVSCEDNVIITCDALGFTDAIVECPGSYVKCPTDSSKGKCDFEASPGDLKYSLRTSDHNGWLLCNGRAYSSSQYPELYAAISGSFGSYLPSYSGYFLKAASTSYASTFKTAQQAGLPNITGTINIYGPEAPYSSASGAFTQTTFGDHGYNHKSGNASPVFTFNASKSNSIYGRSTTVTPQNYSANVFIYAGRIKVTDTATICKTTGYTNSSGSCPANSTKTTCPNNSTYFKCTCNSGYVMDSNTCYKTYASCAAAGYVTQSENDAGCSSGITIYLTNGTSTTCYDSSCAETETDTTCGSGCYQNCMNANGNNPSEGQTCAWDCEHGSCY
ncbi:MAG: tail fiber protein [Alphaproteobacteria bacterium]|nr:tail fiber protein [Alphaproteobacteria bacterium]